MTRRQGLQMKGGVQLPMFAVEVEPEPATTAGPARPGAADIHDEGQLNEPDPQAPTDDRSVDPEVDQ
ncbi:hypothetical protein [Streptomyces sp. NPDC056713]|uniref:hypothetical protein n=1 Tax=Streptomyces sp. NPDC056713 TaxID=3345921 RepID=UPI0036750140